MCIRDRQYIDSGKLGEVFHVYVSFRSHRSIPGLGGAFTTKEKMCIRDRWRGIIWNTGYRYIPLYTGSTVSVPPTDGGASLPLPARTVGNAARRQCVELTADRHRAKQPVPHRSTASGTDRRKMCIRDRFVPGRLLPPLYNETASRNRETNIRTISNLIPTGRVFLEKSC